MPESFLGDGLVFEDSMPLSFTPGVLPDAVVAARLNADNQQLLSADSTLDEARVHEALKDESPALVHELQRLDYKINILLRLAADLAVRQIGVPPACPVRLSSSGLEWLGGDAPPVGSFGIINVYVNPVLPQPLKLPASVMSETLHNGERAAQLRFTTLSEPVVELIEKLIFRHHRRLVANTRVTSMRSS